MLYCKLGIYSDLGFAEMRLENLERSDGDVAMGLKLTVGGR